MTHPRLFEALHFARGPAMENRLMLAALTNQQSHADGQVSNEELRWLVMRAAGGFGMVVTAAAPVQQVGQGYHGQLGVFADFHVEGLKRLAAAIHAQGSLRAVSFTMAETVPIRHLSGHRSRHRKGLTTARGR